MSIPNEIKIGILGAGGKMGMRISANLKKLPNETYYIENAESGIKRLEKSGFKVSAPAVALSLVDVLILAVPDILINKISAEVVPDMKADSTVILLDPAAAYMNQVCIREDLHYTVIHPCHPALFKDQPTLEGYKDHFGGISGLQDIVSTHWKGAREKYELACDIVRQMFAPVDKVFEITIEQMAFLEPSVVEVCGFSLVSVLKELVEEMDQRGIPKDAAMSFLLGHIKIELAIFLLGSNPASDAAMIAMDYGRDKLIKKDWKKVLTDESLHEVLTKMLKLDNKAD
jgi:D-apionate oxidoisomerase